VNDDESRIVRGVGEGRLERAVRAERRAARHHTWGLALAVALAGALAVSVAHHACDNARHRAQMRACVERAP
jgi:hypothetical protein